MSESEQQAHRRVLAEGPDLARGYQLRPNPAALVATRDLMAQEAWLKDAASSRPARFAALTNGIQADCAAFEGQVHRLKLIKR